ncbi:MAG TPA: hypothetical protein VFF30_11460 [Nitrososphaerales archaeon]|nr:hypothetical protein [Nitrososphaerales archaeon]
MSSGEAESDTFENQSEDENRSDNVEEHLKSIDLMSNADAVMSHWQVSQAFMRMAKRAKKKEIRGAFLEAEQRIITNLFQMLSESQLNTRRQDSKAIHSPILKDRPHEIARLAECFPRSVASIFLHSRSWNARLVCHKCQKYVALSELTILDLCAKHHECVAVHCKPGADEIQKLPDPVSIIESYKRYAIMRSETDWSGERNHETLFIHTMYDDPSYNRSTIETLVDNRSLVFDEQSTQESEDAVEAQDDEGKQDGGRPLSPHFSRNQAHSSPSRNRNISDYPSYSGER